MASNSGNGIPIDLTVLAPVQTVTFGSAITTGTTGTFKLGFNSETTVNITVGTAIKAPNRRRLTVGGASESGTTVTVRTASSTTGLKVGASVTINGVGVAGYNGTFTVAVVYQLRPRSAYTAASGLGFVRQRRAGTSAAARPGHGHTGDGLGGAAACPVVGGTANVAVAEVGSSNAYTVTFAAAVAGPGLMTVAANAAAISRAPTITVVNWHADLV